MIIKAAFMKRQHKVEKMMIFLLLCAVCIFAKNYTVRI